MKTVHTTLCALLAAAPLFAQEPAPTTDPLHAELAAMFERPAGTTISDAQKQQLHAFCERHAGEDLGRYGYVAALAFGEFDATMAIRGEAWAERHGAPADDGFLAREVGGVE